uniref:lysosomal membrane ascorbate-dependent ferrireductase CYB561A3 n=1 Tax=Euleptes europaea TaxID=460621 RepID=UPI00253FF455|nr:lysosomal membrane ascorbate-dependent ferrireductase CYB561A3 [Euleptes europaea]
MSHARGSAAPWNYVSRHPPRVRRKRGVLPTSSEMAGMQFLPFSILLGVLGILCVGLTGFWGRHWLGGFAWDGSSEMFNWHPVLMVTGMLVLYGTAALVYRVPLSWEGPKLPWKLLHATLTLAAFILVILGLVAVFEFHNRKKIPNMYSLHSWLGLTAVVLFSCQWLMGFSSFLLPWAPIWLRALYKPIHVFFGSSILSLVMAACISGINEKLFFRLTNATTPYSKLPAEAWFANILGMLILIYGLLVLWALALPAWKRPDANSYDIQEPLLREAR